MFKIKNVFFISSNKLEFSYCDLRCGIPIWEFFCTKKFIPFCPFRGMLFLFVCSLVSNPPQVCRFCLQISSSPFIGCLLCSFFALRFLVLQLLLLVVWILCLSFCFLFALVPATWFGLPLWGLTRTLPPGLRSACAEQVVLEGAAIPRPSWSAGSIGPPFPCTVALVQ